MRAAVERALDEARATFHSRDEEFRREAAARDRTESAEGLGSVVRDLETDANAERKRVEGGAARKVGTAQSATRSAAAAFEAERQAQDVAVQALGRACTDARSANHRLEAENGCLARDDEHERTMRSTVQSELAERETALSETRIEASQGEAGVMEVVVLDVREARQQLEDSRAGVRRQAAGFQVLREQIGGRHADELAVVAAKVKSLVESKESAIRALREQLGVAQGRLGEIEKLFERQRGTVLARK